MSSACEPVFRLSCAFSSVARWLPQGSLFFALESRSSPSQASPKPGTRPCNFRQMRRELPRFPAAGPKFIRTIPRCRWSWHCFGRVYGPCKWLPCQCAAAWSLRDRCSLRLCQLPCLRAHRALKQHAQPQPSSCLLRRWQVWSFCQVESVNRS